MAPSATYSVSELAAEIGAVLADSFPPLWVVGEVQRVRPSQRGHLYFELIEKGQGESILAKLDAVLWRSDHERVRSVLAAQGLAIVEGVEIRLRASVDFYGPAGRLQLVVREVDPLFFLGQLERRRRELLAELASAGLLERNRELPLPELPLTVGLVTSEGSAAYHDFLTTLAESGYGFRVLFVHSAVQGKGAEQELVSALELAGSLPLDCLVLVRGGGSRSDLAVFDSREVARAVALCPVPVVTGLGHEIDQAIADRVAHTAVKTPTKAAELLVARVAEAEAELDARRRDLAQAARIPLLVAREYLGELGERLSRARSPLLRAEARLSELGRSLGRLAMASLRRRGAQPGPLALRLAAGSTRLLTRREREPETHGERLLAASRARLRTAGAQVAASERLCRELSPERTLARGFSITRGEAGRAVRSPADARPDDRISTETAGGLLWSRVEER